MEQIKKILVMCVFLVLVFTKIGYSEKPAYVPDVSVSSTFLTKYIWRGWNLGDEPVVQTDFSISKWGFTLDCWSNYNTGKDTELDSNREFTEIDYSIDYTFNFGDMFEMFDINGFDYVKPLSVSAGYIFYTFPNQEWDSEGYKSHEIYVGVQYDILLQPAFTWYWDVDQGKGSYFLASISHSFEFDHGISLNLGMDIGYNDKQWTTKSGWSDMVFSADVFVPFLKYFYFKPGVYYSLILDEGVFLDASENEFYAGFELGINF